MLPNPNGNLADELIRFHGKECSLNICMEECAELIQAISKYRRVKENSYDMVVEEIADVLITLRMLQNICHISDDALEKMLRQKEQRNKARMDDIQYKES